MRSYKLFLFAMMVASAALLNSCGKDDDSAPVAAAATTCSPGYPGYGYNPYGYNNANYGCVQQTAGSCPAGQVLVRPDYNSAAQCVPQDACSPGYGHVGNWCYPAVAY